MRKFFGAALPGVLGLAAAGCLAGAAYKAYYDQVASGTLFAALFTVCALLCVLPQLESFSAFGIAAKLRAKLHEAEALTAQIRTLASAQGTLCYHLLAKSRRWGDDDFRNEFSLTERIDSSLSECGVSLVELRAMKADYLKWVKIDLFKLFTDLLRTIPDSNAGHLMSEDLENAWDAPLDSYCRSFLKNSSLPIETVERMSKFAGELQKLHEQNVAANSLVGDTKSLIDRHNFRATYRKVLNADPPY